MKYFTNEECLKSHIRSCHQHINCEICGSKHLKKNIKRHLRTHDEDSSPGEIKCEVEGCSSTFSKASNLQKHMKAVHDDIRPFVCGFPGCGMRFAYKHVRNKHENSGYHVYTCVSSSNLHTIVFFLQTQKTRISCKTECGFRVILSKLMKISLQDREVD
jgi:general transcription factor IIIA